VRFLQKRSAKVNKIPKCGNILFKLPGRIRAKTHIINSLRFLNSVSIFKFLKLKHQIINNISTNPARQLKFPTFKIPSALTPASLICIHHIL